MERKYLILAYYCFTPVSDPAQEVVDHFAFLRDRDARGRIYLSDQGINGQMSALSEDARAYMKWIQGQDHFKDMHFKIHFYHEHVFPRLTVKVRKQLVALDAACDLALTGTRLSPREWKEMLEQRDEKTLLLDVRNAYEWEIGHFEGAELPTLEQFREFPQFAQHLKKEHDPKESKVMMYCTGGIRCELYSALLRQEGFERVFQLEGGLLNYGLKEGNRHWKGKVFVFDDRLAVDMNEEEKSEVISNCIYCNCLSDLYYNCANMDCNELFLSCLSCAQEHLGCCCRECSRAHRVRPIQNEERPKPFRRLHLLQQ
jgi:UPF0176 protein